MPKIYSEIEKENIKRNLLKVGGESLRSKGVSATTVDFLVKEVKIPKGSFYLFFESKEALFLSVLSNFILEIEDEMLSCLEELDENHIVNSLTSVMMLFFSSLKKRGIYRFFEKENYLLIARRFEEGIVEKEVSKLKELIKRILGLFLIDNKEDVEAFFKSMMLLIYSLSLDENETNDECIKLLVRGLVLQLVE